MHTYKTGVLLIAHGARDPSWAAPFQEVARRISAQRPTTHVVLSFLEFMTPGIEAGATQLADAGCCEIHVVPMFLGASGHVRRDIPPVFERLRERYGEQIRWHEHAALGEVDAVMQSMADVALSWLDSSRAMPTAR
jgi:sirohydrochlorin cobaltochelatase